MRASELVKCAVCVALLGSACDCEDRIRKVVSNPSTRKRPATKTPPKKISSAPREQEPNDTWSQATKLELTGELRSILGEISKARDVDRFALTYQGPESLLEITLEPKAEAVDLVLELTTQGASGQEVSTYDLREAGAAEVAPVVSTARGPIMIGVRAKSGGESAGYALRFKRRLSGGALESEPNDHVSTALGLKVPGEIQGMYDRPGDVDMYKIEGLSGDASVYTLQVSAVPALTQIVRVFEREKAKTPFVSFEVSSQEVGEVPNLRLPQGTGSLWVSLSTKDGAFNARKPYRLRWLELPQPTGMTMEAEPNDDPENAVVLRTMGKVRGYLHHPKDLDRFRVMLSAETKSATPPPGQLAPPPEDMGVPAKKTPPSSAQDALTEDVLFSPLLAKTSPAHLLDLEVRPTAPGDVLELTWSGRRAEAKPTVHTSKTPGAPVVLCRQSLSHGAYDFSVRRVRASGKERRAVGPDYVLELHDLSREAGGEIEPNGATGSADRLPMDGAARGAVSQVGDVDTYALDLEGKVAQVRRVELVLEPHPLNLDFRVLDDEGGLVAHVQDAGPGGKEARVLDLPAGRYFIEVTGRGGSSCVPYVLRAKKAARAP